MPKTQNIEYKSSWHNDYLKWICGFANVQSGRTYIGKTIGKKSAIFLLFKKQNTQLYIYGCKIGCDFCKFLIFRLYCGMDGTRTRDPLRDRQVF